MAVRRRPPGRPPKGEFEVRHESVRLRLTGPEKALWLLAVDVAGEELSTVSRELMTSWAKNVLKLDHQTTTLGHLANLLGRDAEGLRTTAQLDRVAVGTGGRIPTDWAIRRIACNADPTTAEPTTKPRAKK